MPILREEVGGYGAQGYRKASPYTMTLQGRWRLIVTVERDTIIVEEVTNHHDG
jgi:hypothetical protein